MLPYKAVLAFFMLLAVNSAFVFADDDADDALITDDTVVSEKIVADTPKVRAEDLRPKGNWSPAPFSFPKVTIAEQFPSEAEFEKYWKVSKTKKDTAGKEVTEDEAHYNYNGKWSVEEPSALVGSLKGDLGLVLKSMAAHSAISRKFEDPVTFDKADLVVVQYEVKFQEGLECGGAYMKLLTASKDFKQDMFTDSSPYTVMFGPDKCGSTNKVHFIFRHKNKKTNKVIEHHLKNPPSVPMTSSKKTHLYTLLIEPSKNMYEVLLDSKSVKSGSLLEDFEPPVVPPKEIPDPEAKKPADWVDQEQMVDPDAKKPEDWDEDAPFEIPDPDAKKPDDWLESEPMRIADPEAKKPASWDDEQDGEWEPVMVANPKCAKVSGCGPWKRPTKRNPAYKGKWTAPMIPNPAYKGKWKAPLIPNPAYVEDTTPGYMTPIGAIGFELWSMQKQILFDNILISNKITKDQLKAWTEATFQPKAKVEEAIEKLSEPTPEPSVLNDIPLPLAEQFQLQNLMAFFQMAASNPLRAWTMYPVVSVATLAGSALVLVMILFTLFSGKKPAAAPKGKAPSSKPTESKTTSASASGVKKGDSEGVKLRSAAKKPQEESEEKENMNEEEDSE